MENLDSSPIDSYSLEEVFSLRDKLFNECELQKRFENLRKSFKRRGVELDQLSLYRGLQFIHIWAYDQIGKKNNIAVPFIYQQKRNHPEDEPRSRMIWDNWAIGHSKLAPMSRLLSKRRLTRFDVATIHKYFYTLSEDVGETEHKPKPGQFKRRGVYEKSPWWRVTDAHEVQKIKDIFFDINQQMTIWGLIPKTFHRDQKGRELNWLVKIEDSVVYIPDPKTVIGHIDLWVHFFDYYYKQLKSSYQNSMRTQYPLLSPFEFATFVQKWFVSIHPFQDGNGRTSRFWQDLVLREFSLPFAPSGLLSKDVDISFEDYYALSMEKTGEILTRLHRCLKEHEDKRKELSYDCTLVKKTNHQGFLDQSL